MNTEVLVMLARLGTAAYLITTIVEFIKWLVTKEFWRWRAIALAVSVGVTILFDIDLLPIIGLSPGIPGLAIRYIPLVGNVLTACLIAYTGNNIYDLLTRLTGKAFPQSATATLLSPQFDSVKRFEETAHVAEQMVNRMRG